MDTTLTVTARCPPTYNAIDERLHNDAAMTFKLLLFLLSLNLALCDGDNVVAFNYFDIQNMYTYTYI